ncbi:MULTISPECIES: uroporphyrinogen-III C-methyltransferase [Flavobacterium]|jgi:uroporphyrin-III C-methyltransferase|uniref:uroporphyrinogen-III C-methyltransferase n=1 Tax=Flavobacterium pectinovorum TaxID=29533 RepID=A0AB36NZE7_9FLAO|nr:MULTISPECIES: uroporphyrinogen-III C-methyltransferase [Flavobacterium]KIQ24833.1 uroporphyrin-III methyltransferase [Flavobacterium sp. MEB061]OXB02308.1 uroporphyrinogen-III C-methyltransferase [Flavobacterium pectinovorum]SHM40168.1 uroporphyrin-III C-methyltransferase [Flavobacterium pectinovorum]
MRNSKTPKLTIVGAGPGDAELITLKAIKALENADVVLYDALVNEELLQYATKAEIVFVGKRLGCHAYTQDQINELIVSMANRYGHVVRLKGGDPFIFGRGSEEIEYVEKFGLETAIVPGISSALGVPASVGISLTQRQIAESFWVITGTTSNHKLSKDIHLASKSAATVVILMGMHKLEEIISIYKENRTDDLPIAIIQNGTKNTEQKVVGTISSIAKLVSENKISSPAIIVIGEVVKNTSKLTSYFQEHFDDEFIFQNLNL